MTRLAETTRCPTCSAEIPFGAGTCRRCADWVACRRCGAAMGVDWRFCRYCGTARPPLGTAPAPPGGLSGLAREPHSDLRTRVGAAAAPSEPVPWGWIDLLKVVGLFLVLGIVAVILLFVLHAVFRSQLDALLPTLRAWGLSGKLTGILLLSAVFYGLLALAIYLCIIRTYRLGLGALGFRPARLSSLILAVAAWPVVVIIGGAATAIVSQLFWGGQFSNPQTKDFSNAGATRGVLSLLLMLLCLAVVVPIVEETLFRGLLFPLLGRRLPNVAAVPACAVIFASAHGIPVLIPMLFTVGLALSLLFARTRSLYPGILLHGIQNAVFAVVIWSSFG